jgi:hypothetical protein
MSNYTTQTAELHAVKVDTRVLNSNKINTKKLFINGELFDPSKINGGSSAPSQIEGDYNSVVWKMTIGAAMTDKSNTYNVIDLD